MKRITLRLIVLLAICAAVSATFTGALFANPAYAYQGKSYTAERFDVLVEVQPGGDLLVNETVVFRFQGGPFTYVFRELDPIETDGYSDLRASLDGLALPTGDSAGQVEIQQGNPVEITWHFDPAVDTTHSFELSYRVAGAVRQTEADTLIWRAVPESHEYAIENSTITLRYPGDVPLNSNPTLSPPASTVETSDNQVTLVTKDVPADQSVILTAHFPPGSLISNPPQWQARQSQKEANQIEIGRALPVGIGSAIVVMLLAAAWLWGALQSVQRENFVKQDPAQRLSSPPSTLPPALGVKLASGGTPALATFFDLARRGFFRIDESKSRWGRSFTIHRQPQREPVRPHEQALLDALFSTSKGNRDSLSMSDAGAKIANGAGKFPQALDEELRGNGWLDPERKQVRGRVMATGVVGMFIGVILSILMLLVVGVAGDRDLASFIISGAVAMVGAGGGLFLAGLAALVAGASISPLSNTGEQQAARWKGFVAYLRDVSNGRAQALRSDSFELYLPFAAGAGFAQEWAKFFQNQGGAPMPEWFHTLSGRMDGSEFAVLVALMVVSDTSTSTGAGAGGAGASGGGASGAG